MAPHGLGAPPPPAWRKATWLWHDARGRRTLRPPPPLASAGGPPGAAVAAQPHAWPLLAAPWRCSPPGPRARSPSRGELGTPLRVGRTSGRPPRGFAAWRPSQEPTSRVTAPQKGLALRGGVCPRPVAPAAPRPAAPGFRRPSTHPSPRRWAQRPGRGEPRAGDAPSLVILRQRCKEMDQILLDTKENK